MCIIQCIETENFIIYIFKQYCHLINEVLKIMSLLGHQPVPPKTVENFLPRNALKNLVFVFWRWHAYKMVLVKWYPIEFTCIDESIPKTALKMEQNCSVYSLLRTRENILSPFPE